QIVAGELAHLALDRVEVLRHERPIDDEVVEEPFIGGRADATLGAGEEVSDRRGHQVRGAVPAQRQRLGTTIGDDLDGGVLLDRVGQVDQLAVDAAGKRGAGEAGRDRGGYV